MAPDPGATATSDVAARVAGARSRLRSALERSIRLSPDVAAEVDRLSAAYRSPQPGGEASISLADARSAAAYAAARMPATFAASARAMAEGADRLPGFAPRSLLDVGAGTGATTWAARAVWPDLASCTLVEREAAAAILGRVLIDDDRVAWQIANAATATLPEADLVTAGYVLGELDAGARPRIVERLWAATRGAIVLVEPGSRAGYRADPRRTFDPDRRRCPDRRSLPGQRCLPRDRAGLVPLPRPSRSQPAPTPGEACGAIVGGRAVRIRRGRAPGGGRRPTAAHRPGPAAPPAGRRRAPGLRRRSHRDRRPEPPRRSGLRDRPRPGMGRPVRLKRARVAATISREPQARRRTHRG